MSTQDEIVTMLDDVEARESKLSSWERGFIDSIAKQIGNGQGLTPDQDRKLEEIWDRVT